MARLAEVVSVGHASDDAVPVRTAELTQTVTGSRFGASPPIRNGHRDAHRPPVTAHGLVNCVMCARNRGRCQALCTSRDKMSAGATTSRECFPSSRPHHEPFSGDPGHRIHHQRLRRRCRLGPTDEKIRGT